MWAKVSLEGGKGEVLVWVPGRRRQAKEEEAVKQCHSLFVWDDCFEKPSRTNTGGEAMLVEIHGAEIGWQAAEVAMRKSQTSETCKAVPPHPNSYLVNAGRFETKTDGHGTFSTGQWVYVCSVCEAEAKARIERDNDWLTAANKLCGMNFAGVKFQIQVGSALLDIVAKVHDAALLEAAKEMCIDCKLAGSEVRLHKGKWWHFWPDIPGLGGPLEPGGLCAAGEIHRLRGGK